MDKKEIKCILNGEEMQRIIIANIMKEIISRTEKYSDDDLLFLEYYKDRFDCKLTDYGLYHDWIREDIKYRIELTSNSGRIFNISVLDKDICGGTVFNIYSEWEVAEAKQGGVNG